MAVHSCSSCKWMHTFLDSGEREISICVFDQSENYLQEVGYCADCELDGFAEDLWRNENEKHIN